MYIQAKFETQLKPSVTIEMVRQALEPVATLFPLMDPTHIGGHQKAGYADFQDGELTVHFAGEEGFDFQEKFEALCGRIGHLSEETFVAEYADDSGPYVTGVQEEYVCGPDPLQVKRHELELILADMEQSIKDAVRLLNSEAPSDAGLISATAFGEFNNKLSQLTAGLLVQMRPDDLYQAAETMMKHPGSSAAQHERPRG